ncbi:MAG: GNAT superfamily N-acetyltransferase [Candidatus Azotimanducaceae bacterium]|jgi:GNAT superfamily N-acetyltransferase
MSEQFMFSRLDSPEDHGCARLIINEARATTTGLPSQGLSIEEFEFQIEGELILGVRRFSEPTELMGFISVWQPESFIHHLYIAQTHQRQGLGGALINEVRKQLGTPLHLKCGKDNTRAQVFYETSGWSRGSVEVGPDGPYINYSLDEAENSN